jgi:hypothetical protein
VIFAAILGKRFSPFGGCEGVDYLMMLLWDFITWNIITHSLLHILQKAKIAPKIASKNHPCGPKGKSRFAPSGKQALGGDFVRNIQMIL